MLVIDTESKIIKSWCDVLEDSALGQAKNLANHPVVWGHIALMPDCHSGYGMPIGGVIACNNAVIPNAVGVDIGCGMCAVRTNIRIGTVLTEDGERLAKSQLRGIIDRIKALIPMGEGHKHSHRMEWQGFDDYMRDKLMPEWCTDQVWSTAKKSLGTLGGGNHFIEIQRGDDGFIWLMLHSGSRNLGYTIARYHNNVAKQLNDKWHSNVPCNDLAFLPVDCEHGQRYLGDMKFALEYAQENRARMMHVVKECVQAVMGDVGFEQEINIHHNYASIENHFGKNLWIHRKGATSAQKNQLGIIPGAMGSSSYIVEGLGNDASFRSCSHGAGRTMSRTRASETLNKEECDAAMEGIVWDGFKRNRGRKRKNNARYDLSETPQAYKNIDEVMEAQQDLVKPIVKLQTLAVLKG